MITKRTAAFIAEHPETGIQIQVYMVDCFVEIFSDYRPEFVFHSRYYETETGQKIILRDRDLIVMCEKQNWFLRRLA